MNPDRAVSIFGSGVGASVVAHKGGGDAWPSSRRRWRTATITTRTFGPWRSREKDAATIYETLSQRDVQSAADEFRPLSERIDGNDGYVSLEVNPHLAHDTNGTMEKARRWWVALNRPHVFIKAPATTEGLPMAKKLNPACVLAINGGSSSIKFALYQVAAALEQRLYGKVVGARTHPSAFGNRSWLMNDCGREIAMKSSYLCITDGTGHKLTSGAIPTAADVLRQRLRTYLRGGLHVALAAGSQSAWRYELPVELGVQVTVVNPTKVKRIAECHQRISVQERRTVR